MTTRSKVILSIIGVIAFLYLGAYTVLTPFIRGVVVDDTTKQPVENAWVMATASIGTRTVAGDVGGIYAISRRHLRTGKDGVFYIFPKLYLSFPTPYTFGTMKKRLNLTVRVMDGKRAEVNLTNEWWKRIIFITLPVRHEEREEKQVYYELSTLYGYCTIGGYSFIQGYRSEKCDNWELDYAVASHEIFLKKVSALLSTRQEVYYVSTLYHLAVLYKQKGEFVKALELAKKARTFALQEGLTLNLREYDNQIVDLENRLKK